MHALQGCYGSTDSDGDPGGSSEWWDTGLRGASMREIEEGAVAELYHMPK